MWALLGLVTARAVDSMYMEWRRLHQRGMRQVQQDWYDLHDQTRICRVYLSNVPPGFLQTPAVSPPCSYDIRSSLNCSAVDAEMTKWSTV